MNAQLMKQFVCNAGIIFALLTPLPTSPSTLPVSSQSDILQFENISTEQGLSQNTVTAILQDQQGFMWFGTEGGLNKYDGYQFSIYKHDPDDPQSLSSNVISSIFEDRDGTLWIGTIAGLDRLDRKTNMFVNYLRDFPDSDNPSERSVLAINQDRSGVLWVGTDGGGLLAFNLKNNQFTIYKHDPNDPKTLIDNTIHSIYEDRDGTLWIGADQGLDRLDPATGEITHCNQNSTLVRSLIDNPVYAINEDSQGMMLLGTQKGLFQWNRTQNQINEYLHQPSILNSISDNSIRCIFKDAQGTLWVGTRSGLDQFNESQKRFVHYKHNPNDFQSLISDSIRSVYEDQSGVIWIGTAGGGISKYARASHKFNLYKTTPGLSNSLSDNNIWSVYEDRNGMLWVGTFSAGLNKLDRKSGIVTVYKNNPGEANSLSNNDIRAILEDQNGNLWVGTEHGGLERFDPQTGTFFHYQYNADDPGSLSSDSIFSIYEDHLGELWIGTEGGGLNMMDQTTGTFAHYQYDANDPFSLNNNDIRTIYEDSMGILWIGTFGGVNLFDKRTNRFTAYRNDPGNASSLSSDLVMSIFEDPEGIVWIGTIGGGLNRFDRTTQSFTHYTEKDGLPDNTVYGILAGSDGTLWLSTNKGISKFDPRRETFRNYDTSDGLQGNQFNPGAFFQSKYGEMFFGGTQGLNAFFPEQVTDNPIPPPLVITAFKKFNQTVQTDLQSNDTIKLSHRDSFISFEFAALDFNAPDKNQYAYMLDGFDTDWIQAGSRRYASYTNLPSGEYVFRVKGSNNDGVWNETGIAIPISVTPPFWQTWWFATTGIVLLAGVITLGFQQRVRAVKENARKLESLVEQRTSELSDANKQLEVEIEQRKKAEEALAKRTAERLEQSEARFRTMFETAAVGIGIMGLDRKVIDANPALCRMYGYSCEELRGQSSALVTHPDDLPRSVQYLQDILEGNYDHYTDERRYIRKNGEVFWAQITMSVVKDSQGKPLYLVGMLNDITETKHTLDDLRRSQARFQAVFENAAVGIALMSLDRRPIAFNPITEKIIGYNAEELKDVDPRELAITEDRNVDTDQFQELISGKRNSYVMERRYRRKNGEIFWARINYSLVRDLEGNPEYLIGMIEDIDDQKRASERLAVQEAVHRRILEQRIAERTEELNKANELLQQKAAQEAVATERTRLARDLHDAVTQTLFSATLIADVLPDIWQMNEKEGRRRLEELRQLTRGALAEMRTLLVELRPNALVEVPLPTLLRQLSEALTGRDRIDIQFSSEGERKLPPDVQVAFYRIAQEALNNVVKHSKASQAVVVLRLGDQVRLGITDNGTGFDPTSVTADHLGLKIMRERSEAIRANFSLYSEPGEGTQVTVTWQDKEIP
jgi:PAS domain S-box-containing protein